MITHVTLNIAVLRPAGKGDGGVVSFCKRNLRAVVAVPLTPAAATDTCRFLCSLSTGGACKTENQPAAFCRSVYLCSGAHLPGIQVSCVCDGLLQGKEENSPTVRRGWHDGRSHREFQPQLCCQQDISHLA